MNLADLDTCTIRIRALQELYPEAHRALLNWSRWALDARGCLASGIKPPPTHKDYRSGDYDDPDLDEEDLPHRCNIVMVRAEPPEHEPYDQLAAEIIHDRLVSPGGPGLEIVRALGVAYCQHGGVPQYQWPQRAGCGLDGFCERLEAGLRFAARFV